MAPTNEALETMPTAAVLAHWRPGWFDMSWSEAVADISAKDAERVATLCGSIGEAGIREPIILGTDGRVWDGHHRIVAAVRVRLPRLPVEFAALTRSTDQGCPTCSLPETVHTLWCPHRSTGETAHDVLKRVHEVFNDPSRAWFAEKFWNAYDEASRPQPPPPPAAWDCGWPDCPSNLRKSPHAHR